MKTVALRGDEFAEMLCYNRRFKDGLLDELQKNGLPAKDLGVFPAPEASWRGGIKVIIELMVLMGQEPKTMSQTFAFPSLVERSDVKEMISDIVNELKEAYFRATHSTDEALRCDTQRL